MDEWLKKNLVCPGDHKNLQLKDNTLFCSAGHTYPYVDGIPIMVPGKRDASCMPNSPSETRNPRGSSVDPYVQKVIGETCGIIYRPLINKLTRYPIPELPLPKTEGKYFLDIGCNWGRWCISAAKKGYIPVGIDPSLEAIKAARRIALQLDIKATYVVADARFLPFIENSFGTVFSYSVFQHLDKNDAKRALTEVARVLKEHGTSLIQMPNIFGVRNLYNQAKKRFKKAESFEVRYWSPSELKNTFGSLVGPTSLSIDGFFSLNVQISDIDLLPHIYRYVVYCSTMLRRFNKSVPWLKYFADSLYVKSIKGKNEDNGYHRRS